MGGFYININIRIDDPAAVRDVVAATFAESGFRLRRVDPADDIVDEDSEIQDAYGVLVTGVDAGWVTVYVDDWQDSGALARGVTQRLQTRAIEIWVANDIHWGYNYWDAGEVRDRFADDPREVADTPDDAPRFAGNGAVLAAIAGDAKRLQAVIDEAHETAGSFAGEPVGALCDALGLPFERAFTGYEYFFTDDPADYIDDHPDWEETRHMAFDMPAGRETLA